MLRQLRPNPRIIASSSRCTRHLSNQAPKAATSPSAPTTTRPVKKQPPPPQKSWLTRKVETSPAARSAFLAFTNFLGYGSPKQLAGRRTFAIYEQICATTPDRDREFWLNGASLFKARYSNVNLLPICPTKDCFLPPTFQSWFTVTNLHIWMLTVRFRALPAEHGRHYEQALIDHFFIDIEDRIRNVLQPQGAPSAPYTFETNFYVNPNSPSPEGTSATESDAKKKPSRAPDRIVTRQMKIFKEQWAGMGLSFDIGLVKGDAEMAGAVWRNLLGARGAQGIVYPTTSTANSTAAFRRSVNLVGGEVVNISKLNLEKEETTDDGSGVHDFPPSEADKYLTYPTVMLDVVTYVRRELVRLQNVRDEDIINGDWEKLRFGTVKDQTTT